MFLSWKQNWGVDGLINHHRLSRTVVTMESLLEAFATRTRGVFCKKLDLIVSLMRGEHNITSWWFFESPGDCFWTDEWRGKLTTPWPKYWSWSTWTTGHSIMFMKAKMKQICSNFLCLDIWCPWLIKHQSNAPAVVSIKNIPINCWVLSPIQRITHQKNHRAHKVFGGVLRGFSVYSAVFFWERLHYGRKMWKKFEQIVKKV